jgi:hypothetical protein
MLTEHSSDPKVNAAVAKLVASMDANPYDPIGNANTAQAIAEVIAIAFNRKLARTVRITLH